MANTKIRPKASCHPDEPHFALGLCKSCYGRDYQSKNREKRNQIAYNWAKRNPEKIRGIKRKYHYGITPEEFAEHHSKQAGLCAICWTREATDVDHDKDTGVVRGLLCRSCNQGIGLLYHSSVNLSNAIIYLKRFDRSK